MSDLFVQLLPEMAGLVVTPAAIIGCLLLLDSSRPVLNVALFGVAFVGVYLVICAVVLLGGRAAGVGLSPEVRDWTSIVIGALFLAGAALEIVRKPVARRQGPEKTPAWVHLLEDPGPRTLALAGLGLALVNPNLAILVSGLSLILRDDVSGGDQVVGVLLLLGACLLDFLVPVLAYALLGARGRSWLGAAKEWLIRHNRVVGIAVLLAFGLLFVGRGLASLL